MMFRILWLIPTAFSFSFQPNSPFRPSSTFLSSSRPPSRVVDLDGPTQEEEPTELPEMTIEDVPGYAYDENHRPIPHQPWRRGITRGCEDPIRAPWRIQAEDVIRGGVYSVGARLYDITWYLTSLVITLENDLGEVLELDSGPEVEVLIPGPPVWKDPDDPEPEPINVDEEPEFVWERDVISAQEIERNSVAKKDEDDPDDDDLDGQKAVEDEIEFLPLDQETREEMAGISLEEEEEMEGEPRIDPDGFVDSQKVSSVGKAILEVLEEIEEEYQILDRHRIILNFPTPPKHGLLETQKQFDRHCGKPVIVETQDPWESNRVLAGILLERNSMDIIINKEGRMVTIPQNFVACVRIPVKKRESEDGEEEDYDKGYDNYDEDDG